MDRIARCLEVLARHVAREQAAITGGVALGRGDGDLDLVVAGADAIRASVCDDFLLVHHHVGEKLLVQLVFARERLRVDIFFDALGALADARPGALGWPVLDLDDVLDHKLGLLARATRERPVDPKHAADARALAAQLLRPPPLIDDATLAPTVYARDLDARCDRCVPGWPLAPRAEILALLGYC